MEHLTGEALARLVDETPTTAEGEHLARCRRCRDEVEAIRNQTVGLSHLPDLRPPTLQWESIQRRLEGEGLIRPAPTGLRSRGGHFGGSRSSGWLQMAAGVLLLLGGLGMGLGIARGPGAASPASMASTGSGLPVTLAALELDTPVEGLTLEATADLVRLTESWYLAALVRYRERMEVEGSTPEGSVDPLTRFATLEALMAASQAAVREAPTDPFLNGLLVNMRAEREVALRGLAASSAGLTWY